MMLLLEPFSEYRANKAINIHFLYDFDRSPAHAMIDKKRSVAMETGELFHLYCLEPERFAEKAVVETEEAPNRRKKEYQEWKDIQESAGKIIMSMADVENYKQMKNNVLDHLDGCGLLEAWSEGIKEISVYFDRAGVKCKARVDNHFLMQANNECIVFDLKTTENCMKFARDIELYRYHRQAEWYSEAVKKVYSIEHATFYFVCVEKTAPFGAKIFKCDPDYMTLAEMENNVSLQNYKDKSANDVWTEPCLYEKTIEVVRAPAWRMKNIDELL